MAKGGGGSSLLRIKEIETAGLWPPQHCQSPLSPPSSALWASFRASGNQPALGVTALCSTLAAESRTGLFIPRTAGPAPQASCWLSKGASAWDHG